MAELAFLGAIALAIGLHRMSERLRRLEEAVRTQQALLAGRSGQPAAAAPAPSALPTPATAPAPAPATATAPATAWSPPPPGSPLWNDETRTWTLSPAAIRDPPQRQAARRREPVRLQAFGNKTIEQVVSENLVAIVGGLLVVAGAVFFLSLAISRGWIGETGRVVIALVFGSALVASGLRLANRVRGESGGRPPWAVGSLHGVLCGAGIAVLFLGAIVGTRIYDVLGWVGLPLAVAISALATVVAVKWQSQDLAGFGFGGALAAPILVDAPADASTAAFVVVALLASSAVLVAMGWPWLLGVALVTTAPQAAVWIAPVANPTEEKHPTPVWCLLIASAFAGMAIADAFDAAVVVAVWAFEAVALWWLSGRTSDGRARGVACFFTGLTALHVLTLDAPLSQLASGSDDPSRSLLSLGAVAVAAASAAWLGRRRPEVASRFVLGAAVAALAGASIATVTLRASHRDDPG